MITKNTTPRIDRCEGNRIHNKTIIIRHHACAAIDDRKVSIREKRPGYRTTINQEVET